MPKPNFAPPRLMLLGLAVLLTSCAVVPKPSPPNALPIVMKPPELPALPQEARQPPTPELCLPSCSDGLRRRLESWLR